MSRTHPVLGDSSPEARTSRLKTEVVPASMVGRLRDQLIAGGQNVPPQSASSVSNHSAEFTQPTKIATPPAAATFEEPPPPTTERVSPPPPPPPSAPPELTTSTPASAPIAEADDFFDEDPAEAPVSPILQQLIEGASENLNRPSPPKPKGILVDRRQAQQGRETIRQMREARGRRQAENGGPSASKGTGAMRPDSRRKVAIVVGFGAVLGLGILSIIQSGFLSPRPKTTSQPPPSMKKLTEKPQLIPGSIFKPVEGPLSFPRLPSGLYTGIAKGILADRDVSLTFISHDNGNQMGVVLGVEGWSSPVISPPPEDTALTVNSGGWRIRFIMKRANDDLIVGRWENTFTKEVGEWKVAPLR